MREITECGRISKAELFVTEVLFDRIADLSDDAYYGGRDTEGLILGHLFRDALGVYGMAAGIDAGMGRTDGAIGWFRMSSDGTAMTRRDVERHRLLFGTGRAFAVMVDGAASSFAIYSVEDDVPRRIQVAVMEG